MSVVTKDNKNHLLDYEGVESLLVKINDRFARTDRYATQNTLGMIKAEVNTNVNLEDINIPDTTGGNYPVQITTDGNTFVNIPTASTTTFGLIRVGTANTSVITTSEEGTNYYPVNIDSSGLGYVALPSFDNTSSANTIKIQTRNTSSYHPMVFTTVTSANNSASLYIGTNTGTAAASTGIRYNPSAKTCYCSGGFYEASDERLKNFGDDIEVDLDKLSKLSKKYFTWKDDESNAQYIGVSAQEVQAIYPELVEVIDEEGHLSVSYDKLSVVALKGIDILNDKIKSLEERLERLEKLING